jgi:uncharacterized protein YndB with AHSA1/START domain
MMPARSDSAKLGIENSRRAKVTTPSEREIVIERDFDAPRALVFEAWTKAEHVAHWWDPSGAPLAVCEIDLRPNGAFRFVNAGPAGEKYPFTGVYGEITPPARLVMGGPSPGSNGGSRCTLVFSENDGRTTLTMTFECQSKADRDAMLQMRVDEGTALTLNNLDAYLRTMGQVI